MLATLAAWPAVRGVPSEARLPALALVVLPLGALVAALRTEADPSYLVALVGLVMVGAGTNFGVKGSGIGRLVNPLSTYVPLRHVSRHSIPDEGSPAPLPSRG